MHLTAGRSTFRLSSCRKLMAGRSQARHPTPFCRARGANWLPMRTQDDVLAALEYLTPPRAVAPSLDPVAQICWWTVIPGCQDGSGCVSSWTIDPNPSPVSPGTRISGSWMETPEVPELVAGRYGERGIVRPGLPASCTARVLRLRSHAADPPDSTPATALARRQQPAAARHKPPTPLSLDDLRSPVSLALLSSSYLSLPHPPPSLPHHRLSPVPDRPFHSFNGVHTAPSALVHSDRSLPFYFA
ncbi:hypothetical protein VTN00DRAFT_480 [Thermoascus crustaceus]|uniref:uncharacterized protein n=1 Tax=Thermoascus crustaceus TaxID=5088 RepID=UPI0037424DF0